jgi:site-specific recombinase XerD
VATWKEYKSVLKRWVIFAKEKNMDVYRPTVQTLDECVRFYHKRGVKASALDMMTTAMSTIFSWKTGVRLGKNEQIISLIRGVLRSAKRVEKEKQYFDPKQLLSKIEEIEWEDQELKQRLMKLATLLILIFQVRFTEMAGMLKEETIVRPEREAVFVVTKKSDQDRRKRIHLPAMLERKGVCVVKATQDVLMNNEVPSKKLFAVMERGKLRELAHGKIAAMVREMMTLAEIDKSITPYQCKHSGLSKAWRDGAKESEIADAARWAPGSQMFRKHYKVLSASENVSRIIAGVGRKKRIRMEREMNSGAESVVESS